MHDNTGFFFKSVATGDGAISVNELGILMAIDTDTIIAFKNARAPVNEFELFAPYIGLTILLAVAVITLGYVKKGKRARSANYSFSFI